MSLNFLVAKELEAHDSDIFSIVLRGNSLFTTSSDCSIKVWDLQTLSHKMTIPDAFKDGGHELTIGDNEDGPLAGISFTGEITTFTIPTTPQSTISAATISQSQERKTMPWSLALSPDSQNLVTVSDTGVLAVYDFASSEIVAELATRGEFGTCVKYSPNSGFIATGHQNGGVFLFDAVVGTMKCSLSGHSAHVRCLRFSPGSQVLASAGNEGSIVLHDVKKGEQIALLSGHSTLITALDWNADGQYLVSASFDGKIKLWDFETKQCIGTFTENVGQKIWSVRWCRMGNSRQEGFVVGGSQKVLKFYLPTSQK